MGQDGVILLRSDLRRGEVVVIERDGEGGIVMKKMRMRVRISESEMVFKAILIYYCPNVVLLNVVDTS